MIIDFIPFSNKKNDSSSTSIKTLENQLKELRTRISWTMDYVQLVKQNKDTRPLDEFRKNLEKQFDEDSDNQNSNSSIEP